MTKQEFVDTLRRSISGVDDYNFVNETVEYYQDYIEKNLRMGRSEVDIMNELGDPKLIAKSILASKSVIDDGATSEETTGADRSEDRRVIYSRNGKNIVVPAWLAKVIGGVVVVVGAVLVLKLLSFLFPIILVGAGAYFIYRFIRENF